MSTRFGPAQAAQPEKAKDRQLEKRDLEEDSCSNIRRTATTDELRSLVQIDVRPQGQLECKAIVIAGLGELLQPPAENSLRLRLNRPIGLIERFRGVGPCELFLFLWLIRHVYSLSKTAVGDASFQSSRHQSRDSAASDFSLIGTIEGPHESDLGIRLFVAALQCSLPAARTQS